MPSDDDRTTASPGRELPPEPAGASGLDPYPTRDGGADPPGTDTWHPPTADPGRTSARPPGATPDVDGPSPSAGPAAPPPPGYEVLGLIDRGGMGAVYKARDVRVNRVVALKVMLAGRHAGPEYHVRFLAEAEAVAALSHPGVVGLFEFGDWDGQPFFALEYCSGGTLAKRLGGTPLPPREAADLVALLADAVAAAHARGIVHRDLKPGNVLFATDGRPKVADFGLAKFAGSGDGVTRTGALMGTPSYMAPEQARGDAKRVGPAADVWALGAVLYECLTGRPPFRGSTDSETLLQVLSVDPVAARALNPSVPRDLETVCHKCLEKEPDRRYPSAVALGDDLRAFLAGRPVAARPVGASGRLWRWARRNPVVAAAVGVAAAALLLGTAAAAGFGLWALDSARTAQIEAGNARSEADRADTEAARARENATRADREAAAAHSSAEAERTAARKAQFLLAVSYMTEGVRLDADSDPMLARLHMAYPLVATPDHPEVVRMAREQLGGYRLRGQAATVPAVVLFQVEGITSPWFSPDGKRVVMEGRSAPRSRFHDCVVRDAVTGDALTSPMTHPGLVYGVFSPDGRLVATRSGNLVRIWDSATGSPVSPPIAHADSVYSVAFSPDSSRVVTAGRAARIWDTRTGEPFTPPLTHSKPTSCAEFSPDGRRVVTASEDGTVRVWDTATGAQVSPPLTHSDAVECAVFSPDGRRVATASQDRTARVWDARSGRPVTPPLVHANKVLWVMFSLDGRRVATASHDRTARVWDAASGMPVSPPLTHVGPVTQAQFSPDGRQVATASWDGTARVWDAATGRALGPPLAHSGSGHSGWVDSVSYSPDGRRLLTTNSRTARVWEATMDVVGSPVLRHGNFVNSASFSPDGRWVVTGCGDGTARVWDAQNGTPVSPPVTHSGAVGFAVFSPDGRRVVTTSHDGSARVWDATTGAAVTAGLTHGSMVVAVAFSPDGRRVVTGSFDKTARVWDANSGRPVTPPLTHTAGVSSVAFSPDGRRVATSTGYQLAQVWDAQTGATLGPPLKHSGGVNAVAFSPDGRRVVTACTDGTARVWEAASGALVDPPLRHAEAVVDARFSPDGRLVATASSDKTARVWDAATGTPRSKSLVHAEGVKSVAFSPDGRRVVTASEDGTARVWMADTGVPASPPLAHAKPVAAATFSPDGRRVVTASQDRTARIWDVSPEDRPAGDVMALAQFKSGRRIDPTGAVVQLTGEELSRLYADLRTRYPSEFTRPPEVVRRWREQELRAAAQEGDVAAAEYHFWWLVAELGSGKAK